MNFHKPVFTRLYQVIQESEPKQFFLRFVKSNIAPLSNPLLPKDVPPIPQSQIQVDYQSSEVQPQSNAGLLNIEGEIVPKKIKGYSFLFADKKKFACIAIAIVFVIIAIIATLVAILGNYSQKNSEFSGATPSVEITANSFVTTASAAFLGTTSSDEITATSFVTTASASATITNTNLPPVSGCLNTVPVVSTYAGTAGVSGIESGTLSSSKFTNPTGIKIVNSTIYVTESLSGTTIRMIIGNNVESLSLTGQSFSNPSGQLGVDQFGKIFIPFMTPLPIKKPKSAIVSVNLQTNISSCLVEIFLVMDNNTGKGCLL